MVARSWQRTVLAVLAVALLAAGLARAAGAGLGGIVLAGVATLAAAPLGFCGVSLWLALAADTEPRAGSPWMALGSWLREGWCTTRAAVHMALEPWHRPEKPPEARSRRSAVLEAYAARHSKAGGPAPVLLVHGLLCNRAVWWRLRLRLAVAGYGPILAVNLEPPFADIDSQVPALQSALQQLAAEPGARPLTIIAHSMGGLVARALLAAGPCAPVGLLITLATPHAGTALATGTRYGRAGEQLRYGSPWLRELAARPWSGTTRLVSIYGSHDNLVSPCHSLRLAGADNHCVPGLGHFAPLTSPAVAHLVCAQLAGPAAGTGSRQ